MNADTSTSQLSEFGYDLINELMTLRDTVKVRFKISRKNIDGFRLTDKKDLERPLFLISHSFGYVLETVCLVIQTQSSRPFTNWL